MISRVSPFTVRAQAAAARCWVMCALPALWLLASALCSPAATFPGNASIVVANDQTGALTANPANNTLTVSCWFRISIPSSTNVTDNMVMLMDRSDGNESANFSYLVRLNVFNGNIEFLARGASGAITNTLIARPYLDRWYHVAVVRQQGAFSGFVDGRQLALFPAFDIGNAAGSGLSVGGIAGNSRLFMGDIVEVAIYQSTLSGNVIQDRMFKDQRSFANLKGYYKLAYSTNAADFLRNFVSSPPPGTDPAVANGSGTIAFEQTDQAGEQSLFDSRKNKGQDAITPLSGAFSWSQTALARPVPGIAFDFRVGYSSATPTTAPADGQADPFDRRVLGPGWRHTFDVRLAPAQNSTERDLLLWDGSMETWDRTNTTYQTRHHEYRGELVLTNFDYEWTSPERLVYHFHDPTDATLMAGRLTTIRDFNGNQVQLFWNEDEGYITNVVDPPGGAYQFNYNTQLGLLTNVTFGAWQVKFAYDATNRLISKTLTNTSGAYTAVNATWQFGYGTNGLLAYILDPRGNTNVFVQYDRYGRQTNTVDALGRATATEYGVPGNRQMRHTDPASFQWIETYDRKGHILAQQDPLTNTTRYTYDDRGNRISITEPLGWTTYFGYDSRANVIARTNALGELTRWAFHGFFNKATNEVDPLGWTNSYVIDDASGNLLRHYDDLGTLVSYAYRTNGLVESSTDANGHVSRFTYDANGFLIARTDAATNTWEYTVNDVGWRLTQTTPFYDTTWYDYDLNGNTVQTTDPLNRTLSRIYDANGNLLAESDGKSQFTRYAYDAANQRVAMTNRAGSAWIYSFTPRGKLDRVTDPLGNTTTNFYDKANRLIAVSDPLGNTVTNQYDGNGNIVALFDPLGQRWTKTFDRLNRAIAQADPLGNTKQTSFDAAGRIKQVITPNGYPSTHDYDGRGRLTRWVEAETWQGQPMTWRYDYDGVGNITNITDALSGHYVMTYGPRNERLSEQNQDGFTWQYTYDELLRLETQRDPNGVRRTREYDPANRLTSISLSTGREDTYDYDNNDNPRVISRRLNGGAVATTSLTYDILDRVTRVVDPNNQVVSYGFDALSRIVRLIYPGTLTLTNGYDALGRLISQTNWAGGPTTYAYDKVGRLLRRTYPNGVTQSNVFDTAGQITSIQHQTSSVTNPASIQIALSYAYDRNGNKTGGSEKGTLEWPLPTLTDESARFTPAGRLIDRKVVPSPGGEGQGEGGTFSYTYDTSGNMTNAVKVIGTTNAESWTLAYDEDNRTTSILWSAGPTNKFIANRYDALGRRFSRAVNGQTTRYVLDLSGSMERVLCDLNPDGTTNWYVHGPDLCYRVDSSNNVVCYHADALANVIAITGPAGTNLAQYAYTPYGRSLGSTNFQQSTVNSQPYTFVGSQGVMEELPGLYFMRARYYSADASVFLSTDPVKKIGPGWKSVAYSYAGGNPIARSDPGGNIALVDTFFLSAASEVVSEGTDDLSLQLSDGTGMRRSTELLVNAKNIATDVKDIAKGVQALSGGTDPLNYTAEQAGKLFGQAVYKSTPSAYPLYSSD